MPSTPKPKRNAARDKVRKYRDRMRAKGMRPIQIWVPDTRTRAFRAQARRQALAVAQSDFAAVDQEFIDSVAVDPA
jgi:hypothetical protein